MSEAIKRRIEKAEAEVAHVANTGPVHVELIGYDKMTEVQRKQLEADIAATGFAEKGADIRTIVLCPLERG